MNGLSPADGVGLAGAFLIVLAYFLLQAGRLDARSVAFSLVNGVGATAILFSLLFDFNLAAFAIEFFWLAISLYGLVRAIRARNTTAGE